MQQRPAARVPASRSRLELAKILVEIQPEAWRKCCAPSWSPTYEFDEFDAEFAARIDLPHSYVNIDPGRSPRGAAFLLIVVGCPEALETQCRSVGSEELLGPA